MTQITKFHGVFPPVRPLLMRRESWNKVGMATLAGHLIASKVNGVLLLRAAGEFCHMTNALRLETTKFCVRHINRRIQYY